MITTASRAGGDVACRPCLATNRCCQAISLNTTGQSRTDDVISRMGIYINYYLVSAQMHLFRASSMDGCMNKSKVWAGDRRAARVAGDLVSCPSPHRSSRSRQAGPVSCVDAPSPLGMAGCRASGKNDEEGVWLIKVDLARRPAASNRWR